MQLLDPVMQPRERPILFQGAMVRAILAGTKTQTRRVEWKPRRQNGPVPADVTYLPDFTTYRSTCPYGQPGDRLWVRESFIHEPADYCWEASVSIPSRPASTVYRADFPHSQPGEGWKPSIHMPRQLCRLVLEITRVRVERLQAISDEDAAAEGWPEPPPDGTSHAAPRAWYAALWESINGPSSWAADPWVWVVEFRRTDGVKEAERG